MTAENSARIRNKMWGWGKRNLCVAACTFHHSTNTWSDPRVSGNRRWWKSQERDCSASTGAARWQSEAMPPSLAQISPKSREEQSQHLTDKTGSASWIKSDWQIPDKWNCCGAHQSARHTLVRPELASLGHGGIYRGFNRIVCWWFVIRLQKPLILRSVQ